MSDQNPPAFPNKGVNESGYPINDGMTLRDYFAAKAMQALIASNQGHPCSISLGTVNDAYSIADLMLEVRGK